ncbi:MAG TPA: type II toxin-antitoxin system RelE/ParE family toxin [Candidatus Rubrimentiphilum sp.]|nr:type II toxin-antitoxin system RelE/ParE family toxin [Candidatus Rubrimentiphilum sp.]
MIRSFSDTGAERLFKREPVRRFQGFENTARRKLILLDEATSLHHLKGPGTSLEALKGDRKGQYSIRINDRYRVCFVWKDGDAYDVEIVDYH